MTKTGIFVACMACAVGLTLIYENGKEETAEKVLCRNDWHMCKDNQEFADSGSLRWEEAKIGCKAQAKKVNKYGEPVWPWSSFSRFYSGDSYVKTGIVTIIEQDALFTNMFGTTVHSRVICSYDLNKNKSAWEENVVDIQINPN